MPRKVNTDQIEQIDEILKHEDPEFVKELEAIDGDALKLAELEAAFAEAEKKNTRIHRFWNESSLVVRIAIATTIAILILGPAGYFGWTMLFPEQAVGDMPSLELIADKSIDFDTKALQKNLLAQFIADEFLMNVDQVFHLKPKRDVYTGHFGLLLEVPSKKDLATAEQRRDEIIEVLNNVFRKADVDDFAGVRGKENFKEKMLEALNVKTGIRFLNVRYSLIVFN